MGITDNIAWGTIIIELFGGLAIFLFGMEMITAALKAVAGSRRAKTGGNLPSRK